MSWVWNLYWALSLVPKLGRNEQIDIFCCRLQQSFLEELEKTVALLAFEDVSNCPVGELLDISQRLKTASEVNAAILTSQSHEKGQYWYIAAIYIMFKFLNGSVCLKNYEPKFSMSRYFILVEDCHMEVVLNFLLLKFHSSWICSIVSWRHPFLTLLSFERR